MSPEEGPSELFLEEYDLRLVVDRLRREVDDASDPSDELWAELLAAEERLSTLEQARNAEGIVDTEDSVIVHTKEDPAFLGPDTTGLEVTIDWRMPFVPTACYHLLKRDEHPLITCLVKNAKPPPKQPDEDTTVRVLVTSFVEGYSAQAVDTVELERGEDRPFNQLPTLFPQAVKGLNEMTRATLHVKVENLDGSVELHRTQPIWLLARTAAPLELWDPKEKRARNMTHFLGAFVTPNAPSVMAFVREAARYHPSERLYGYQKDEADVEQQVRALFQALKAHGITYVDSANSSFGGLDPRSRHFVHQRVRLPRESLKDNVANCLDGTVLFASLLEAISLGAAIVLTPAHAFVAWKTWPEGGGWRYLETTRIGSHPFEGACEYAEKKAERYHALAASTGDPLKFQRWPLRLLRAKKGITPME